MTSVILLAVLLAAAEPDEPVTLGHPGRAWRDTHLMGSVLLTRVASTVAHREPGVDVWPDLVLHCDPDKDVFASISGFMVGVQTRNPVTVPLSLDGGPFVEVGGHGIGATLYFDQPKGFIRRVLGHHHLLVRVWPYKQPSTQDILFDLDGLDAVVGSLFHACGWDPRRKQPPATPSEEDGDAPLER